MLFEVILSVFAVLLCIAVLVVSRYIAISKMRIDSRDQKKKPKLSTSDVLSLLRKLKPFPISVQNGWKLHSVLNSTRVWIQEVSFDSQSASFNIYSCFKKIKIPSQLLLQVLRDVSKTPSWKPGCLATSIVSKTVEHEPGSRMMGMLGSLPVQHDIVMEEASPTLECQSLWRCLFTNEEELSTVTKEHRRYWHREDNGVCWHLQMAEEYQEWLFFLAQPVEDVDKCLLTVVGHQGQRTTGAKFVSDILSSLDDYVTNRKIVATKFMDMKQPTSKSERLPRSYSSSEDQHRGRKGMFLRFRSLVENPTIGAAKLYSIKQQLLRSTSILRHRSPSVTNSSSTDCQVDPLPQTLKTTSLDRRKNMPQLSSTVKPLQTADLLETATSMTSNDGVDATTGATGTVSNTCDKASLKDNNNIAKQSSHDEVDKDLEPEQNHPETKTDVTSASSNSDIDSSHGDDDNNQGKDIDRTLDADVDDQEMYEQTSDLNINATDTKVGIQQMVTANQMAAELLSVALQASNIDLSKSIQEQVINSGGWMFCGLDNDVVVLKKVSIRQNIHCYLGKGVIQTAPTTVWNAIRNPRTKFTYDDSLKKVDVLEKLSDSIKIVYYYHEVLQLFKTESYDMIVTQSERVDKGEKYVLAMQSVDREGVALPESTNRVMVLPSGWIIEPLYKEKRTYSMVTHIMQIDHGDIQPGAFEDFIAKQPMSIAYLRQYLKGCAYPN